MKNTEKLDLEQLKKDYNNKPYEVGDWINVRGFGRQDKSSWGGIAQIEKLTPDGQGVLILEHGRLNAYSFDDIKYCTYFIGKNPFPDVDYQNEPRPVEYNLYSIIFQLTETGKDRNHSLGFQIKLYNDNPFVEVNGEKKYYQRPLVWELLDKQLLIESIYNNIACGTVVLRKRSREFNNNQIVQEETGFYDIVDGKQRLNTVLEFMRDGFPDMSGNYYSEFSDKAKHDFTDHKLFDYYEFNDKATDTAVIKQFLKINHSGKPQSKTHIDFVKSINDKFNQNA